jgi:adenylosuccinate synthase
LDILNGFHDLQVCIAYDVGGEILTEMPASLTQYRCAKPVYKKLPGWENISDNIWDKGYDSLPENLKYYINFIEQEVNCPIKIVSVGPQRHETIIR